jgi:hypothetical protein
MTKKTSLLADAGSVLSPPASLDEEGKILRSGRTVPPPPSGNTKVGVPPFIGAAPAAVNAAAADEGFHVVSRTTGLKTTPLCLATVVTTALLTTPRTNMGGFDSSEPSEEEDSPPLLPSPRAATRTHDEIPSKLIDAIDAITESE